MRPLTALQALVFAAATVSTPAQAHGVYVSGKAPEWTWDPWITVPLAVTLMLFAAGAVRLTMRASRRDYSRRFIFFTLGWLVLAAALVSPLHELSDRSFAAHMIEHELLMLAAAPLLVLSQPMVIMLWGIPGSGRRGLAKLTLWAPLQFVWSALTEPVTATLLQAAALLLWHAPALFDLALAHRWWHIAQHASFIASALLFWTAMLRNRSAHEGERRALAALCLFVTSIVSGALGALMAFSESPWYIGYAQLGMAPFGLTPSQDQQLAGLMMWVPGGLVHAVAALVVIGGMLNQASPIRERVDAG